MLLWLMRALYLLVLAGSAARISSEYGGLLNVTATWGPLLLFAGIMGFGILVVAVDLIYSQKKISSISAVFFGLMVGSLLGHLLSLAFAPTLSWLTWPKDQLLQVPFSLLTTIMLCYICVSVLLQTKDDFRFVIPYVEFSRQLKGGRPLILDTSVIIDGRIADIADTGFIDQTLVVPRFVLDELQAIADSGDKLRRNRGRRGLDILDRLQKCKRVEVEVHEADARLGHGRDVDSRLVLLAKNLNGKLVTNDFNLGKMAKIQGIETVNINEVSNAAKPPVMHGEQLSVRLVKEGEGPGQGIGYLEDGTMVVAEMGKNFVGTEVNLVVTSVLQTNAGRMVFGRIDSKNPEPTRATTTRH